MKRKKVLSAAACALSILLLSGTAAAEASAAVRDGKSSTIVNLDRQHSRTAHNNTLDKSAAGDIEAKAEQELGIKERIYRILHPEGAAETKKPVVRSDDNMIMGGPVATQEQCVRYLLRNNPAPKLNVSPEELVAYYYEEGTRTGIRPDIAFAQALKETGYFRYGGTVVPAQNNYCGLGTTSATVQGAYFATPRLGVKAHIQHLLAYVSLEKPKDNIVDPRYDLVRKSYGSRTLAEWKDLNGRWAVPGVGYGQSILEDYYKGILGS